MQLSIGCLDRSVLVSADGQGVLEGGLDGDLECEVEATILAAVGASK